MRESITFGAIFLGVARFACACEPSPGPPPSAPAAVVPVASASASPLAVEPGAAPSASAQEDDPDRPPPDLASHSEPNAPPPSNNPPGSVPFDRGAAAKTLGAVNVQSCATPTGPRGPGRVKLTFATSGHVRVVAVEPPFAGTAVGSCIMARFRSANVPAFSGPEVNVGKTFTVN